MAGVGGGKWRASVRTLRAPASGLTAALMAGAALMARRIDVDLDPDLGTDGADLIDDFVADLSVDLNVELGPEAGADLMTAGGGGRTRGPAPGQVEAYPSHASTLVRYVGEVWRAAVNWRRSSALGMWLYDAQCV